MMSKKWINIIRNWINCYFPENENNEQSITLESLLNIILHLRENLNLDESKSSALEAHSVDEFILEKYPEFRFENGTIEANTEEDLYMAASLLLLFVCVNSKDIDMKNAMCSQLNVEDQEVILKFNRFLMTCPSINFSDVNAAIHDACGSNTIETELERTCTTVVSETPPALRSLHGEVRRLQASLEAERFDRNYLQEELSRTNLKLDKLMKGNEEYKQDIINLKAKISMCCGHENNVKSSDEAVQGTAKLLKEIQVTEERLVETQGQLEDTLYERDTYRSKVNELKEERDKWLVLSQQQTDLVSRLTEELESERQTTLSLRELVAELRQHNQLTHMDSSQIECDDPNASIHSFQHNTSFCSEACANVVEVQLGEERAKIQVLNQQIQTLQEQLQEMSQKHETEKLSLEKIISDKDDDIFNLKHRINEEIELYNNMTVHYSDAFSKLNNDVNELEQKLKDTNIQSRLVIETKMQEIQTLQEEKLSLLQSLNDETTKMDRIIKKLKSDLEYERNSKAQQKEDYENHIMKLNEKVLNRNNELVELQNNVFEKSERIEELHLEIRNDKQAREKIVQHHHNELEVLNKRKLDTENNLQQKQSEIKILSDQLKQNCIHNEKLKSELGILRNTVLNLNEACSALEENKILLLNEIGDKDNKLLEQNKEIIDLRNKYSQEMEKCQKEKDEYLSKNAMLSEAVQKACKERDDWRVKFIAEKDNSKRQREEYESRIALLSEEIDRGRENAVTKDTEILKLTNEKVGFEQDMQLWKTKYNVAMRKIDSDKLAFDNITFEKDQNIESILANNNDVISKLKHSHQKEIDDISRMSSQYSDTIERLNNKIKELTLKIEDVNIFSRAVIEKKMDIIHFLQKENLALLLRLENECKLMDSVTKKFSHEMENQLKSYNRLQEDYNNIILESREKDVATTSEIAELQNWFLENSKQVENLHLQLTKEKEENHNIMIQHAYNLNVLKISVGDFKREFLEYLQQLKDNIIHCVHQLNSKLDQSERKVIHLNNVCSSMESDKVELNMEMNEWKNKYSIEQENIEKLRLDYESRIAVLSEEMKNLNEDARVKGKEALKLKEILKLEQQNLSLHDKRSSSEKDYRDHPQEDFTTSDLAHSSIDSNKTISDLEKIIHDKNRTITTLQTDITFLKTMIADSENKILDYTKELEISHENNEQLSSQLKKIVSYKNEEIAELKRQITKMSVTENRASQIIRVSAKYQAIILKRIAEIKTNTVLKELTNFGNSNGDNELRRSLNAGTITMEDLENFLETTDKHLRRCSEKQIALQKERDRLCEVNRINESEIINMRKFLTELSVSFQTFNSIKDLYTQKLTRVVSMQRTVRRELLNLDGRVSDASMLKLERGYAAVMQDLTECVMSMERWVERSIGRKISSEKIKQAFMSDDDRASLASTTFQNTSLEIQLEELENSFKKLLEETLRAQKDGNAKDPQAATIMELRVQYEDKLNRMKAKMKELYTEQIESCMAKQKKVVDSLERELAETREKLKVTSKAYEDHIRGLATDLWNVSEKFLATKDELGWLQKKQCSGSLMSLQHVHSSGLLPRNEEQPRVSDAASLRSLPIHKETHKREGRGLPMSDEEGEVFDNRFLQELCRTPRAAAAPRLSELRRRNSLLPPHLQSSYPAETQFAAAVHEEDIKCFGPSGSLSRGQRKEVGITAYKKPGPPTPSKQAGRLSATDSELRESLRPDPEANVSRKTSTPSRLRSLFRSNKSEPAEGTPRTRRMGIFRKKL